MTLAEGGVNNVFTASKQNCWKINRNIQRMWPPKLERNLISIMVCMCICGCT